MLSKVNISSLNSFFGGVLGFRPHVVTDPFNVFLHSPNVINLCYKACFNRQRVDAYLRHSLHVFHVFFALSLYLNENLL